MPVILVANTGRPMWSIRINLASGGTRGFSYDAAGNVVSETRPGGTYSYTYNAAGRLATFSINGVLQASYAYDALGRQVSRALTSPTAVTIYSVYDSQGRRLAEYNKATGALIREYVWNGWEPVVVVEGGAYYYVRADHIGRPVFATNASGVKVWTASYLPFGGVQTSTVTLPDARFPGQWYQSESGLHQNWMRDYDPTTGSYIEADPLGLVDGASWKCIHRPDLLVCPSERVPEMERLRLQSGRHQRSMPSVTDLAYALLSGLFRGHTPIKTRNSRQGLTTLATLAAVVLLAVLALTLQTRSQADLRLLSRLTDDLETQAAKDSLTDRLRVLLAAAMSGGPDAILKFDSTPLILTEGGRDWEVRVQDVEGQVDLYLATPDLLALLNINGQRTAALRTRELAALPPGARFPVLPMTAARFGLEPSTVDGLMTQRSSTGMLRLRTAPEDLRLANLPPGPREGEQVTTVAISIREVQP